MPSSSRRSENLCFCPVGHWQCLTSWERLSVHLYTRQSILAVGLSTRIDLDQCPDEKVRCTYNCRLLWRCSSHWCLGSSRQTPPRGFHTIKAALPVSSLYVLHVNGKLCLSLYSCTKRSPSQKRCNWEEFQRIVKQRRLTFSITKGSWQPWRII